MNGSLIQRVRQVWRLSQAPRWAAPAVVGLALAAAALDGFGLYLFIPLLESLGAGDGAHPLARGFDALLAPVPQPWRLPVLVLTLCTTVAAKNLAVFAGGFVARYVDGWVAHRLRSRIFAQTLTACLDYRPDARITDVVATLSNNTWKVSNALSLVYRLAICAVTFLVFLGLMLAISAPLTAVALVLLGAAASAVHLATRRAQATGRAVVEENRAFGLRMWESMGALQLIRSFGREGHEVARFEAVSERIRRRILALDLLWALPGPIAEICGALLIGALVLAGSALGAGLAPLAAFLALLYRLQGPTREFLQCKVALDGLAAAVDDVDEVVAATASPFLASGDLPAAALQVGVELRNVSYRYAADGPLVLDRVSLIIPARTTTAIVGRSGAGKSTLLALLFRFRDPSDGVVLADGRPLPELDLASWRSRVSLMPQEAQLFNASAAENIGYGDLAAPRDAIQAAADVAGCDFLHALPDGLDTELGDRGARLSGGQRQRVALARTVLKAPDLLLLDEPTNALDIETELAFQAALRTFSRGRTVVVVAHRLSTVMAADHVIVLDGGRVAEAGPPRELLAQPGHFARLHGLQYAEHVGKEVA
ncbi:ABC transporter ATP-binding protein [Phenylobacterium sp.]|uniref:ABC transporter ATP-binding protein n=1 Tax=Phenylobacterium sp. TaxID=1871053 RepID=UPI0035B46DD0